MKKNKNLNLSLSMAARKLRIEVQKELKKSRQKTSNIFSKNHQELLVDSGFAIRTSKTPIVSHRRITKLPPLKSPVNDLPHAVETPNGPKIDCFQVYRLGEVFTGARVAMANIGLDIGTKTIVLAYNDGQKTNYISEINGYWPMRNTKFIQNMLNDPTRIRSDGTKRPARWIELDGQIIVLGKDAEELAYATNDTLYRPMAEGGIGSSEQDMTVLASIVQGILETAENDIGKFTENVNICYCTTAPTINKETNIEYHERIVDMIIEGYETEAKLVRTPIKESHAIVLDMDEGSGSGIGISWGAGTVTVSYVKYGLEIFSFAYVGAGDWIDDQVARRHGYDPELSKTRKNMAGETPTTVAKAKIDIDLSPGTTYNSRVHMDISLHYDVLIKRVINGIVQGFKEHESKAKIDEAIPVYLAGGTSSPKGFVEKVYENFDELDIPFDIGNVVRSNKPLYSVASGCLKAAEYGIGE